MRKRPSFCNLPRPFIVTASGGKTVADQLATIKMAEFDGTDAFDLHMQSLERQYHNLKDLTDIIHSTNKPVLALYYRWNMGGNVDVSDEDRVAAQLIAIEAGAAGLDITADIFDPQVLYPVFTPESTAYSKTKGNKPLEITYDPEVIKRQKELIDKVHGMGAEVLMSCHSRVTLTCEQIVEIAKEIESRGADFAKIVGVCLDDDDLLEALKAQIELKRAIKIPFQFQCHGERGKVLRVVAPMLGSALVFCNQQFKPGGFHDQPLVHAMRAIFDNCNFEPTKPVEEEIFL